MQTIFQGKPVEGGSWQEIPAAFVADFKRIGHSVRGLVLRDDAEQEKQLAFNEGIEKAAHVIEAKNPALAKLVRRLKNVGEVPA